MADRTAAESLVVADRYQVLRPLARGGMARVFLARDTVLQRQVALKIMLPRLADDETFVARFQREAQSAAKLNHPNVVAVYDWGVHDDTYFMAMEYVEGQTLGALLRSEGPLAVDDAVRLAAEVADGLRCAHEQGTVHRDVKPANIMITPSGQAKVTDFGIARAVEGDIDLTEVGKVMGTAAYFSPEQAQGHKVGPRSDLYSLGVVMFEMVTGSTPFTGKTPLDMAIKHIESPAPLAGSGRPAVPAELEVIIDRLLAKDPDDRYPAAVELIADLDRFLSGQPAATRGPTAGAAHDENAPTAALDVEGWNDGGGALTGQRSSATAAMPASMLAAQMDGGSADLDVGSEPDDRRRSRTVTIATATIVLLAAAALTALLVRILVAGSEEAEADLATVPSVTVAPPEAEVPVTTGSTTTSDGPALIEVPGVVGVDGDTATRQLTDLGFTVIPEPVTIEPGSGPIGVVVNQAPDAGQEAPTGGSITLGISTEDSAGSTTVPATTTTPTTPVPSTASTTSTSTSEQITTAPPEN